MSVGKVKYNPLTEEEENKKWEARAYVGEYAKVSTSSGRVSIVGWITGVIPGGQVPGAELFVIRSVYKGREQEEKFQVYTHRAIIELLDPPEE